MGFGLGLVFGIWDMGYGIRVCFVELELLIGGHYSLESAPRSALLFAPALRGSKYPDNAIWRTLPPVPLIVPEIKRILIRRIRCAVIFFIPQLPLFLLIKSYLFGEFPLRKSHLSGFRLKVSSILIENYFKRSLT